MEIKMANVVEFLKEEGHFDKMTVTEVYTEIVGRYLGSCESLAWDDEDFLEQNDLLDTLDEEMFECEQCGWWCSRDEEGEEPNTCIDCTPEEEEEEED